MAPDAPVPQAAGRSPTTDEVDVPAVPLPPPLTTSLVVVLVRHAERVPDGLDPPLSPAGRSRARLLARMLGDASVQGVYVTATRRSRQTGTPTATSAGLALTEYVATDAATLATTITTSHSSGTTLVVAHSNTVADIAAALGAPGAGDLGENEFDRMFVLSRRWCGTTLLRLRYGAVAH